MATPPALDRAPRLSAAEAERLAEELYGLRAAAAPLSSERDQNFCLTDRSGARFVLKIANAAEPREILDMQNAAMALVPAAPRLIAARRGEEIARRSEYFVRLFSWIEGACFAEVRPHTPRLLASLGRTLAAMDSALAGFDHPAAHRAFHWDLKQSAAATRYLDLLPAARRALLDPFLDAWRKIEWSTLRHSVIHNDANDYNVLADAAAECITGVLDFGDMVHSATVCNLAVALAYAMLREQDPIAAAAQVVAAYHAAFPLTDAELESLYPLAGARLCMSVLQAAWQTREAPGNRYLNISNAAVWELLERLARLPAGWPAEVLRRATQPQPDLAASRRRHLGPSLSLSYEQPLHIVRGWMQHLYDACGRRYLDCVNNVAHVGHCHPRVVQAGNAQAARLNTNTRYLYEPLNEYIERLAGTLPARLSVVYLVCSGSEANELALRLARAHTGRKGVIVVDVAYHGNTNALVEISPYKFEGPGGGGRPDHVQVARISNAGHVAQLAREHRPGAFFCESALSCAGQVMLPEGYLREAYAAVRAAGGVCVADEVQTGFGRAGSHFWMFETQGAVPDIVTMGKPIGNGHPMGAVATTPEIAASFANGMEYFNTFGGNPVSCSVGLAVLNVIRDENLQQNALAMGQRLVEGLRELQSRHATITDVRGQGLFLGFGMTGAQEASALVNRMKESGVLLSTDGPRHNVIKIKPPMVFGAEDSAFLLERLDRVLLQLDAG